MLCIKDEKSFIQEITKINYLNDLFIEILSKHDPENNTENFIDFPPRYTINLHNCDPEILDKLIIILTPLNNLIKQITFDEVASSTTTNFKNFFLHEKN